MSSAVNIFNQDGSVTAYTKVSERLPEFHEKFPIGEGYRLISTSEDYLSRNKGLLMIIEKLIENNGSLDDIKNITPLNRQLFTCQLCDESNEVVASASALKSISQYKDYEIGETAALQRLLAKLGFGGETFDYDEEGDFQDQGLKTSEPAATLPQVSVVADIKKEAPSEEIAVKKASKSVSEVPPALLRQLQLQCDLKSIPMPEVETKAQAKAALKKIRNTEK